MNIISGNPKHINQHSFIFIIEICIEGLFFLSLLWRWRIQVLKTDGFKKTSDSLAVKNTKYSSLNFLVPERCKVKFQIPKNTTGMFVLDKQPCLYEHNLVLPFLFLWTTIPQGEISVYPLPVTTTRLLAQFISEPPLGTVEWGIPESMKGTGLEPWRLFIVW